MQYDARRSGHEVSGRWWADSAWVASGTLWIKVGACNVNTLYEAITIRIGSPSAVMRPTFADRVVFSLSEEQSNVDIWLGNAPYT